MVSKNRNTILIVILVAEMCSSGGQLAMILQPAKALPMVSYGLVPFTLGDLSRQAQLIILGNVSDEKDGTTELLNHLVSIGKVIKGTYAGNTINVPSHTPPFEDDVDLTKGEEVNLFLYKEKMYGGQYMAVGMQGKYDIDPNGVVHGYNIKDMSVGDLQKNITDLLSKPVSPVNATISSKYANDADMVSNDSDLKARDNGIQ